MNYCSINYKIKPEKNASISINERGFLFGDGIFETFLIHDSKIYNFQAHYHRLEQGLKSIKLNFNLELLETNIIKLIKKNQLKNGFVRIYISRGIGSIGYYPKENIKPLITIQTKKRGKKINQGVKLHLSKITKISSNALPINYKLAQGLNSTLAKIEALENNCFDSLLLNEKGQICETSSANIFWVKNNQLHTPKIECGILAGTIRQKIIELSKIKVNEVTADLNDLLQAEEIFITNISYPILNVRKISPKNKEFTQTKYCQAINRQLQENMKYC